MPTAKASKKDLELYSDLQNRFAENMRRHEGLAWADVHAKLEARPEALRSLQEMEATGGEPDVMGTDKQTGAYLFCDCAAESPAGRRNICYDAKGYQKRLKAGLPVAGSALEMAAALGIEVLDEQQYLELQSLGDFDTKSQSWLKTPADVAKLGGGVFADRRFGRVFVYNNTPESFYRVRGFRGILKV